MSMPVPPPVDPSVLGKILLIQTTIHAITSQVSIAEFICRGLEEIPGTSGVAVRIHDIVRAAPPALAGLLRNASDSGQDALQEARSGSTAQPPAKRPLGGTVRYCLTDPPRTFCPRTCLFWKASPQRSP